MSDSLHGRLLERIGNAGSLEELRSLRDRIQEELETRLSSASALQIYEQLNAAHDALIVRVITLAEQAAARQGKGSPPVPYAYLLFGSGGRMEQTMASDQDSGIIYDDPPPGADRSEVDDYFRRLAERIVGDLVALGYPPCEGGVLSTNERWRGSVSDWRSKLDVWFSEAQWEMVRHLLIVSDGRAVYGDTSLLETIKNHFHSDMLEKPVIVRRMLDNTMRHKVLLGLFGQLLRERYGEDAGGLDIKYGAYIPMVNAIRMMAIQEGLRATSTLDRIGRLMEAGRIGSIERTEYQTAFSLVLELRLMTSERGAGGLYESSGKLPPDRLTRELTARIKRALRTGRKLQRHILTETMNKLKQGGGNR